MKTLPLFCISLVLGAGLSTAPVHAQGAFGWTPPQAVPPQALAADPIAPESRQNIRAPHGDTFGSGFFCPIQVDIRKLRCAKVEANLQCTVTFAERHVSSEVGGDNVVVGYIDFDTDQNPATGTEANTDFYEPPGAATGLGMDYFVEFFAVSGGQANVFDAQFNFVGTAPVKIQDQHLKVSIPLSELGDPAGGIDFATVLGSECEPTDIAPNQGHGTAKE